ncbi:MAG: hypothetical protein FWE04_02100 [Oscillospiraceae bacterium]|nr:hypothetical protein [Oscillospiraceae bacterium]
MRLDFADFCKIVVELSSKRSESGVCDHRRPGLRLNHRNLDFANGSPLRVSQENESYFDEV